jgi:hypothetical protein
MLQKLAWIHSAALELDQSRTRTNSLDGNLEMEAERLEENDSTNHIEIEFRSLKSEVELLSSMIETTETKHQLLISLIILSFIFCVFISFNPIPPLTSFFKSKPS